MTLLKVVMDLEFLLFSVDRDKCMTLIKAVILLGYLLFLILNNKC